MIPVNVFDLTGRTVLILGGGGIIGSRLVLALAEHGASVAVADFSLEKAEIAAGLASPRRDQVIKAFQVDLRSKASISGLSEAVSAEIGEVDVLINNAAAKTPNFFAAFDLFPLEEWDEVLSVNLTGAMLACQVFGPGMADRGRGSIINTLSIYGVVAPDQRIYVGSEYEGRAINTPAVYSASKAGLWGLTMYLSTYWADRGVRVNAITPGGVFSGQNEEFSRRYSARVPLGRMADRDELSGAVIFLASDASSYVNGHNLVVDGGLTCW